MFQKIAFVFLSCLTVVSIACRSATAPNENANTGSNLQTVNAADLPPEFSTSPLPLNGAATPGIPAPANINVNNLSPGATPTPGIPDPKKIGKTPVPKGATPTPGIPAPEVLREQMKRVITNSNLASETPKDPKGPEKPVND